METRQAEPLKAAVIGTGKISEEHLGFLRESPRARLVGVCDLSPAMARFAGTRFGVERAFTDYKAMLAEATPDVLHILTPPQTHVQIVTDGLRAGAHVIVEKPVAPTHAEFETLWELSRETGRRLIEDHNYRFNPEVRRLESLVADGRIGEVRDVDVRMTLGIRAGGRYADENLPHPSHGLPAGVLHEFVTHLAYLTLRFLPSFERVSAHWSNHGGGELFKYDDLDALVIGENVHARIRFTCSGWPDSFLITVRGTEGSAYAELFHPHVSVSRPRAVGAQLSPVADQVARGLGLIRGGLAGFWNKLGGVTPYQGLQRFLEETYQALEENREPPVTYADMEGASALVTALLEGRSEA
jgi:predicted dehydrogenase